MDFYIPVQANNEEVPLPLQCMGYKYNFLWPLDEKASTFKYALKNVALLTSILCYVGTLIGEFTFISENVGDIPALADCLTTTLMGVQFFVRIIILALRHNKMRSLMQRFYKQIYFTTADDAKLYKEIKIITLFTDFFTKIYYIPMFIILVMYVLDMVGQDMSARNKPYIYRMAFRWYDAQAQLPYIITAIYTTWLTISTVGLMAAEDFILCIMLCHTSYRYKELQKELRNMLKNACEELKMTVEETRTGMGDLHCVFRKKLYDVFRRQQKLHSFIDEAKQHFRHQIFYCMCFGVLLLCVVSFQFQRTAIGIIWVKYIVWIISQTAQFIMIGYFGQMLMDETTAMFNSYYMCQWEELLTYGNTHSNKLLMGDIKFAILNAKKAVVFDGMKIFPLTHSTVGAALRSAMSYFMFLNTMNEAK